MNDIYFDENAFIISVGNIYNTEPEQYRRLHGAIIGCFIDIANNLFKNKSIEFLVPDSVRTFIDGNLFYQR